MRDPMPDMVAPVAVAEVSGSEWASLMWGFFWRGVVFSLACAIAGAVVGGVVGGILGVVMVTAGLSLQQVASVTRPIGFLLGLVVGVVGLRFYITWLLRSRFGPFRLVLVRYDGRAQALRTGAPLGILAL